MHLALKDITHSPEEILQMLKQNKQNRDNTVFYLLLQ